MFPKNPEVEPGGFALELAAFAEYGILPRQGGLFDQDPYHVYLIKAGLRAFGVKREKDNKKKN